MTQGAYISGFGHAIILFWALFAGFFWTNRDALPIETMDVSILTPDEFDALMAPAVPDLPQPEVVVTPEPVAIPEAVEDPVPEQPAPEAEVTPEPAPAPELPSLPTAEAVPDQPDSPEPPTPAEAERVAPETAPEPPVDAVTAPEETPEVAPDAVAEIVTPDEPATAPEEAAPEIVTEAETPTSSAPVRSVRPTARPTFTTAAAAEEPEPDVAAEPDQTDAIAEALAAATTTDNPSLTPVGPPLSRGEKDALRVSVGKCWNTGSLSTEALNTTVEVFVAMNQDGTPDDGSIRLITFSGGSEAAADKAYSAARRAIIRCGAKGFDLPREKYSHWNEIEMVFNPSNMRIK